MSTDLHKAVAGLIDTRKIRLFRDGEAAAAWQTIPSVFSQLEDSRSMAGGQGGSMKFASLPVISTGVVALLILIEDTATTEAVKLVGETRGSTPDNLRAIAANLKDAEQIGWWTERLLQWTAEARERLRLDPSRPRSVRGARCPACGAKVAYIQQDGEPVRTPALAILWVGPEDDQDYHGDAEWIVRAVECRKCGKCWFRGGAMNGLIDQVLSANRSKETMADIP